MIPTLLVVGGALGLLVSTRWAPLLLSGLALSVAWMVVVTADGGSLVSAAAAFGLAAINVAIGAAVGVATRRTLVVARV